MNTVGWYLILIALPGGLAILTYALQRWPYLSMSVALVACGGDLFVWSRLAPGLTVIVSGQLLNLTALNYFFLPFLIAATAFCIIVGKLLYHGRNFASVALLILTITMTIFVLDPTNVIIAGVLLTIASLVLVFAIVDQPLRSADLLPVRPLGGAVNYVVMMFIALTCFVVAALFLNHYDLYPADALTVRIVTAMLTVALLARLGAMPLHIWLPEVAEQAEVMVTVLAIGILDTVAFVYMLDLFAHSPYEALLAQAITVRHVIEIGAAVTVIAGALIALKQNDLRRFVAYSFISDTGLIFFGLATLSVAGISGALLEIFYLIVIKLLLFTSVGMLHYCTGSSNITMPRGLGRRLPITAIGFVTGGLALVGLPPFGSLSAKLLLYSAAAQYNSWWLIVFVTGAVLLIVAYTRVVQGLFFGTPTNEDVLAEPRTLSALIILLVILLIASGLYPQVIGNMVTSIVHEFNFIR